MRDPLRFGRPVEFVEKRSQDRLIHCKSLNYLRLAVNTLLGLLMWRMNLSPKLMKKNWPPINANERRLKTRCLSAQLRLELFREHHIPFGRREHFFQGDNSLSEVAAG